MTSQFLKYEVAFYTFLIWQTPYTSCCISDGIAFILSSSATSGVKLQYTFCFKIVFQTWSEKVPGTQKSRKSKTL